MKQFRLFLLITALLPLSRGLAQVSQAKPYKLFFEKTYLHTDRETYADGEDIWFKAYLVNGQTNELTITSNNLYVELISPQAKIIDRKVIRMDGGLGNGDFHLKDSIVSGAYHIRAYTSWMRNFGESFVFEKTVNVASTIQAIDKKNTVLKNAEQSSPSGTVFAQSETTPLLRFFPEGGSMLDGVAGIIAFKVETSTGAGLAAKGQILSSSGMLVTEFSCDSSGMGSVLLSTQAGEKYTAKGTFANGKAFAVPLPAALSRGYSLFVKDSSPEFKLTISTNAATLSEEKGKQLVVLAKSKGKPVYTAQFPLNDLSGTMSVPKASLPAGITVLTLYDATGKPQCERLVFVEAKEQPKLTVTTDRPSYSPKGKVTVTLRASSMNTLPLTANLSLAAVDAAQIPVNEENIISYLNLTSEISGAIHNPDQYFDEKDAGRALKLDLLLLTQGWRDFIWKRLADSVQLADYKVIYPVEQGITVSGKVKDKGKPVTGANVTLTANGSKSDKLLFTTTDNTGSFYIDNVKLFGTQSIGLTTRDNHLKSPGTIYLDSLFSPAMEVKPYLAAANTPLQPDFLKVATERKNKISLSDTLRLKEIALKTGKTVTVDDRQYTSFGYKDEVFTIDPKDYDHSSLLQYLLHYSNAVSADNGTDIAYHGPKGSKIVPKLIVNGKFIRPDYGGHDRYYSLSMPEVKKVVIKHLLDMSLRDVYVTYLTIDPKVMNPVAKNVLTTNVNGYYDARTFFTPVYKSLSNKLDLRTTIHWEPSIITNANGEATITFYNADPKAKIRIVAEGISDKGLPLAGSAVYEVK